MKVKELIKTLTGIKDKEQNILISVDEEGNHFSDICEVCEASGEEVDAWNDEGMPITEKVKGYIIYPN